MSINTSERELPSCTRFCEVRANGVFHTFECFLRRFGIEWNRSANNQGKALNAR